MQTKNKLNKFQIYEIINLIKSNFFELARQELNLAYIEPEILLNYDIANHDSNLISFDNVNNNFKIYSINNNQFLNLLKEINSTDFKKYQTSLIGGFTFVREINRDVYPDSINGLVLDSLYIAINVVQTDLNELVLLNYLKKIWSTFINSLKYCFYRLNFDIHDFGVQKTEFDWEDKVVNMNKFNIILWPKRAISLLKNNLNFIDQNIITTSPKDFEKNESQIWLCGKPSNIKNNVNAKNTICELIYCSMSKPEMESDFINVNKIENFQPTIFFKINWSNLMLFVLDRSNISEVTMQVGD